MFSGLAPPSNHARVRGVHAIGKTAPSALGRPNVARDAKVEVETTLLGEDFGGVPEIVGVGEALEGQSFRQDGPVVEELGGCRRCLCRRLCRRLCCSSAK